MAKKIGRDKWKHFFAGIGLGAFFQAVIWYYLGEHPVLAVAVTFIIVFAISYGFELFSLFTGLGHYEFKDAIASTIGGAVGMLIILSIIYLSR